MRPTQTQDRNVWPPVFPNPRVLAGWGLQLAPFQPRALWVANLFLHHVEALVQTRQPASLDRFAALVLQGLVLNPPLSLAELEQSLLLDRQLLLRVLVELAREELVEGDQQSQRWQLTTAGIRFCQTGSFLRKTHQRGFFHFRECQTAGVPPIFLALDEPFCTGLPTPDSWTFNPDLLDSCVAQSADWKQAHGFPLEIDKVFRPTPAESGPSTAAPFWPDLPPWSRVMVDRAERLVVVLALVGAEAHGTGEKLLGLAIDLPGWTLRTGKSLFSLGRCWEEAFPELVSELPADSWREAWQTWCQGQGFPIDQVGSCTFRRCGPIVQVTAGGGFLDRLKGTGVLIKENWLLAGKGCIRALARVELVEEGRSTIP